MNDCRATLLRWRVQPILRSGRIIRHERLPSEFEHYWLVRRTLRNIDPTTFITSKPNSGKLSTSDPEFPISTQSRPTIASFRKFQQSMKRSSVRRSFAVEVKSSGRRNAVTIPSRASVPAPSPKQSLAWPDLLEQPPEAASVQAAEPRRILPSLIVPEPPQMEPDPAPAPEARLPRVRRVKASRPRVEDPPSEIFAQAPAAPLPAVAAPAVTTLVRRAPRKDEPALALGERWKRRLPRWSR